MTKLRYDPRRYYLHDDLTAFLKDAAKRFPKLARLRSLGKSHEGRDLWLMELTNSDTGKAEEKPGFWIDGNTHATELAGSAVCLYTIHHLLTRYGTEDAATRLLDERVIYVLPRVSPDGAEHVLTTGQYIRSSTRMWPIEEKKDGLHPEDVDGDGDILQMRVEDPLGEWKVSAKDKRLMIKRTPDDRKGPFYRIYREGKFENFDGFHQEVAPSPYGLDLNRQFPYDWMPEHKQWGAGPFPLSEPETRAVVAFITSRKNITGVMTYHTFGGVLLRPYSNHPDTKIPNLDLAVYKALGKRAEEIVGVPCKSVFHDFRYDQNEVIHGVFDDWCYDHLGVHAFTLELWSVAKKAGVKVTDFIAFYRDRTEKDDLKILKWQDRTLGGKGFVRWRPFKHPQLGRVEIGGWRMLFTWSNPPPKLLPEECRRAMRFTFAHASAGPRLVIRRFASEDLGNGLAKLTLELANEGYLPTNVSQLALEHKSVRPVEVELDLPKGMKLLIGKKKTEVDQLAGTASTTCEDWANAAFFAGTSKEQERRLEWLVRGRGRIGVVARSERAGIVRADATTKG